MPQMPQLEIEDKASWQVMVEQAMQAAVRRAIARVLDEELAAALGPRYARAADRAGYRVGPV